MAARLRLDNTVLPGVTYEYTRPRDGELARCIIFDPAGNQAGAIVNVGRRVPTGTEYGWRPAAPGYWGLTSKTDAARKILDLAVA